MLAAVSFKTDPRREALGTLIQEAYDRGDDAEATSLLKVLNKGGGQAKQPNPYVMDKDETRSNKSDGTSVAFVREVVPNKITVQQPTQTQPIQTQVDQAIPQAPALNIRNTELLDPATWFEGASSKEESDKAYAIMSSKKGTLEMENGDVIHNGRILRSGNAQMKESLAPLSPGLTIILKGLTSYIQLTVFDKEWLIKDQKAWGEARIYGGDAPVEELTIDFEVWGDCMELFCSHLVACGWGPIAERFKGHVAVVKKLRKDFGWMVALRHCRLVRQGVMRKTVDKSIGNYTELQEKLLVEAKTTAESYNERHYRTNPYAPGRPKANICPLTNKAKSNATSTSTYTTPTTENRHAYTSNYKGNGKRGKGNGYKGRHDDGRRREDWKRDGRYAGDRYAGDRYIRHRSRSRSPDRRDKSGNPVKGRKA
ncbi:uncharacterized protein MELLADRAFT_92159 [Melampsora larici-populina 98AG31]|uniref:Uncharacterized protein n=1 Tax=Melampsora larici-populina (strain 98AG31 / pathotype 3-4-7) TaxID=747676 RepID=F4S1Q4_MELLP|nr:uncharacterized protein MELLADRAFT_92159 [Melampsora larici-populina 98AG31]EGG01464.1 hypothetical protein MELLADRAFT_92159 [Melampsora larici-populina 98AG31]